MIAHLAEHAGFLTLILDSVECDYQCLSLFWHRIWLREGSDLVEQINICSSCELSLKRRNARAGSHIFAHELSYESKIGIKPVIQTSDSHANNSNKVKFVGQIYEPADLSAGVVRPKRASDNHF